MAKTLTEKTFLRSEIETVQQPDGSPAGVSEWHEKEEEENNQPRRKTSKSKPSEAKRERNESSCPLEVFIRCSLIARGGTRAGTTRSSTQ